MPETDDPARRFVDALNELLAEHSEHRWQQVGRCVYCECGSRLYQGTVPEGHPTFTPPYKPTAADKMRERWNIEERTGDA